MQLLFCVHFQAFVAFAFARSVGSCGLLHYKPFVAFCSSSPLWLSLLIKPLWLLLLEALWAVALQAPSGFVSIKPMWLLVCKPSGMYSTASPQWLCSIKALCLLLCKPSWL